MLEDLIGGSFTAFKNVGQRSTATNYRLVSLLSVVGKVFEKLVNNRTVDHLQKCGFFNFQCGCGNSRSTADLLTVVSAEIARNFNRSRVTSAVALDISKAFDRFVMLVFFTNLSLIEFHVRYLVLLRVGVPKCYILGPYTFPATH